MYCDPDIFYIDPDVVPEPFKAADDAYRKEHENDPKIVKKPREIPMPFISGPKTAQGPLYVTEDWYVKKKKKWIKEHAMESHDLQIEMMQLIAKRDRIRYKIGKLNPNKKKDSKRIVAYNVKLKDIDMELEALQIQTGININKLDRGSRLGRFVGSIKRKVKKVVKKVKRWYKRNEESITNTLLVVLPVFITSWVKWVQNWISKPNTK